MLDRPVKPLGHTGLSRMLVAALFYILLRTGLARFRAPCSPVPDYRQSGWPRDSIGPVHLAHRPVLPPQTPVPLRPLLSYPQCPGGTSTTTSMGTPFALRRAIPLSVSLACPSASSVVHSSSCQTSLVRGHLTEGDGAAASGSVTRWRCWQAFFPPGDEGAPEDWTSGGLAPTLTRVLRNATRLQCFRRRSGCALARRTRQRSQR